MMRRLSTLAGWIALACSAAFSSTTANASIRESRAPDLGPAATAPGTVRVRFELAPSHDGRRTVIVNEDSGRRTPVGELEAGVACEVTVDPESWFLRGLRIACGSGLEVWVSPFEGSLAIRGSVGIAGNGPRFSDDLPLPAGTTVEPDGSLDDPEPPPDCEGTTEAPVDLSLRHRLQDPADPRTQQAWLGATTFPFEAHIDSSACENRCIGKGDAAGHHYEYRCTCTHEPYETSLEVHVRNRTVYATETESMPDVGRRDVKGFWSVPCGARLRYPAETQVLKFERGYFEDAPEEVRAKEKDLEDMRTELGQTWGVAPE